MKRQLIFSFIALLILTTGVRPYASPVLNETNHEKEMVLRLLEKWVDRDGKSVGIVVGIIDNKGNRIYSYGKTAKNGPPVDGDTIFEIGSVTKVFTAAILADMAEKGELALTDPAAKFLPEEVKMPAGKSRPITLADLATHTSGLPRLPRNLVISNLRNPYVDYTVRQMYQFLSGYTLARDTGEKYEYSNLGMGLLGHVLTLKAGTDYETLVKERVLKPLGMKDTMITVPATKKPRFAVGHTVILEPTAYWDIPTLAGAGALRSTVNDLLKFLAANLGLTKVSISNALSKTHQLQKKETDELNISAALGWHIFKFYGSDILFHDGGTGGFRSVVGFDKTRGLGVVVLSNSANDCIDVALTIFTSLANLKTTGPTSSEIKLEPTVLKQYEGKYRLASGAVFTITFKNNNLYAQLTGQQMFPIYPQSQTKFFYKVVDAQLTFFKDKNGNVTHLVLHQNGIDQKAQKIN